MRSPLFTAVVPACCALALLGCSSTTQPNAAGHQRKQLLLVSQQEVNQASTQFYAQQNAEARQKGQLITSGPEYSRVNAVMRRIIPQTGALRGDAPGWPWELVLINDTEVNAHVMAGGKVTVYTGLIRKLNLTDDEIAAVIGHEIAHALREHTREKVSQQAATQAGIAVAGALLGAGPGSMQAANVLSQVGLNLPFSRSMESEADEYGLELAARAGYNPQAAITLWDKMASLGGGGPRWLSTHPAPADRKAALAAMMPKMMPLYEQARRRG